MQIGPKSTFGFSKAEQVTHRKVLVRPNTAIGKSVEPEDRKVLLGMESDDEPENIDEELEPEEVVDALRKKVEPLPSEEEQRKHRVTHLPFRSWCPHCVAAAANDDPHRSKKLKAPTPLEIYWDNCFPCENGDWAVVLVGRE